MAFLCGDPELRIGRAIAVVAAAPLHDLEEEALAIDRAVDLEILPARLVAVVQDVARLEPLQQAVVEPEAGIEIVVVVGRNLQRPESVLPQRIARGEDVAALAAG